MDKINFPKQLHEYEAVQKISINERFASYVVEKNGHAAFCKLAVNQDLHRDLENEVWFSMTLNRIAESNPDVGVKSSTLLQYGEGWYLAKYINGRALLDVQNLSESNMEPLSERIAEILSNLDGQISVKEHESPLYEDTNSAPYNDLLAKIDRWMGEPLRQGLITIDRLNQAKKLIENYRPWVKPSFQHGDFVPWHILVNEEEGWVLVDGEHSSLVKPRFYDLAYIYSRLFTRGGLRKEPNRIVRLFLEHSKIDGAEFIKAFLPVITLRALGMHTDALNDLDETDYREDSKELLDMCFKEELGLFMK